MTLDLPTTQCVAYQLAEDLREPANRLGVRRVTLDDPSQEEVLLRKLGTRRWGACIFFAITSRPAGANTTRGGRFRENQP